jgi:hypothetical protein
VTWSFWLDTFRNLEVGSGAIEQDADNLIDRLMNGD